MAIRNVVESDISGKTGAQTFTFGWDEDWYDIDLTAEEQKEFKEAVGAYLKASRRASGRRSQSRLVAQMSRTERAHVRTWAEENGYELNPHGKIPNEIIKDYEKATGVKMTWKPEVRGGARATKHTN